MIEIRKSDHRGHARHGWLDSHHTFSFADYYDPKHMGFRSLRVINEDRVAPGRGFGSHPHRDMEILSYVISGKLAHKDNMGHQEILGPNEIQHMSAGTGVVHSEFNPSDTEPVHFFQVWIEPVGKGVTPVYKQIAFAAEEKHDKLKQLAALPNADVFVGELSGETELSHSLAPDRYAWVHVIQGDVTINGHLLQTGDAASLSGEPNVTLAGQGEVLLFDLA